MNWELYEVWTIDEDGFEDLVDTTHSLKEARELAIASLSEESIVECVIFEEDPHGDLQEIERIK